MTSQRSVVFAEPVRTAIGTFGGSLKDVPAANLGAVAIRAAVARAKLRPDEVEAVVMGNVVQAGTKMNPARQAAVHAGLPVTIPALTVNRVCGSGAQAIVSAAQEISVGNIAAAVAGGMENMDQAPFLIARGRWGYRMGDGTLYDDSVLRDGLNDAFSDAHSGWHSEDLVEKFQVSRAAQDHWALRSQQRFTTAQTEGHFKSQIVPVEVPGKKGPTPFDKDEHNRPDTTLETLARLKPAFRPSGTITAGNAPGLNDAASAMVLADGAWAEKRGLAPTARLVSYASLRWNRPCSDWRPCPRSSRPCSAPAGIFAPSSARRSMRPSRPSQSLSLANSHCPRRSSTLRVAPWRMAIRRRHRCGADDQADPLDAPRWSDARPCHAVHRRRSRHRIGHRSLALKRTSGGNLCRLLKSTLSKVVTTRPGSPKYLTQSRRP
jgi:acetyl-CoA C-acetyltransferase